MRIGILTSTDTRHRYFVNALCADFNVVAIGYEETGYSPAAQPPDGLTPDERRIVEHHFAERSIQEEAFFGQDAAFIETTPTTNVLRIAPGQLNTSETLDSFLAQDVDTVVVYGTNLIREPLISRWPGRMLNMHLGLSPYYRGTATNFYPLVNEEPQYVGATILLIDAGIDTGPIVRHARPDIVTGDMPHTIGCKAILAGIDAVKKSLSTLEREGKLTAEPQWKVPAPRLYLRKDYDPRHVVKLYACIKAGMIDRYAQNPSDGDLRLID